MRSFCATVYIHIFIFPAVSFINSVLIKLCHAN